jgi:hypothetical protein
MLNRMSDKGSLNQIVEQLMYRYIVFANLGLVTGVGGAQGLN